MTRGDIISRAPPFRPTRRVPRTMAFGWAPELSRTAGSPATGNTPLFFYDTTGSSTTSTTRCPKTTTPPGTTTLLDTHLQQSRTSRAPEPGHHQRQELVTDSPDVAVRDDSNGTPEGSTTPNANRYTAVRVLSFANPRHRVLIIPNPAFSTTSPTTPTPSSTSTSAPDTELTYPTPRMHREGQPLEEEEPYNGHLGQLQHGLACPRDPPHRS